MISGLESLTIWCSLASLRLVSRKRASRLCVIRYCDVVFNKSLCKLCELSLCRFSVRRALILCRFSAVLQLDDVYYLCTYTIDIFGNDGRILYTCPHTKTSEQSKFINLLLSHWPIPNLAASCLSKVPASQCRFSKPTHISSSHSNSILDLLLLARPFDDMRQIANRNAEREIKGRKHDREENPPASHGCDECEGTTRLKNTQSSANSTCHGI